MIAEQRENAKLPKNVTRGIVHQIPSKVQPSLVQGDINFYSKEIAFTIGTAAVGGFAIRLAGKGISAIRAARAARATSTGKTATTASSAVSTGSQSVSNEAHNATRFARYKEELAKLEATQKDSRTVIIRRPEAGATPHQEAQIREYVSIANLAESEGHLSIVGRVRTTGRLRKAANKSALRERKRAAANGTPYKGVAGHGPDTTWTGNPNPPFWLDVDKSINSSIGSQARNYPIGFRPKRFMYEGDM